MQKIIYLCSYGIINNKVKFQPKKEKKYKKQNKKNNPFDWLK